jgi:uncharacterized protein involved in exopolysaccharide biosynthesis
MLVGGAAAFAGSYLMPVIFRAEATLAPASSPEQAPGITLPGQLGGLANIAGVNLGGTATDRADLALAVLQSREFITGFIRRHDLMVPLFAGESWDRANSRWLLDPDMYDSTSGQWTRDAEPPRSPEPSSLEAYQRFVDAMTVEQDALTGIVKVSLVSRSPVAAQQWLEALVNDLNRRMRDEDVEESERSIDFLSKQASETSVAGIQQVLYQVVADQMQKMMLAKSREEYAFKIVDPPVQPDVRYSPKRLLMAIFGMVAAAALATLVVIVRVFAIKTVSLSSEKGEALSSY